MYALLKRLGAPGAFLNFIMAEDEDLDVLMVAAAEDEAGLEGGGRGKAVLAGGLESPNVAVAVAALLLIR